MAHSAAGASLSQLDGGAQLTSVLFIGNTASANSSSLFPQCSRELGLGGGGAMCIALTANVSMTSSSFVQNIATSGGAGRDREWAG